MGCAESRPMLKEQQECYILEFMTLFQKSDFEKGYFRNRVEKAYKVASKLPGRFRAYDIRDVQKNGLIIKGMPELYVLYIKLPKEGIWISADLWEEEFLNAQMIETIHIWTQLGATDIKFSAKRLSKNSKSLMGDIGLGLPGKQLSLGGSYNNGGSEESDLSGHLELRDVNTIKYESREDFIKKNGLYYVKFAPEWLNIMSYKLNNEGLAHIDFQYTFTKGLHLNGKLHGKFDELGISFGMSESESTKTAVTYNITFNTDQDSSSDNDENMTTVEFCAKLSVPTPHLKNGSFSSQPPPLELDKYSENTE